MLSERTGPNADSRSGVGEDAKPDAKAEVKPPASPGPVPESQRAAQPSAERREVPSPMARPYPRPSGPTPVRDIPTTPRSVGTIAPVQPPALGLVRERSQYSVSETTRRVAAIALSYSFQIVGDIDFAGDAGRAGWSMKPARQLVLGHPALGTALIVAAPTLALDLPLRVLIYEDRTGVVWVNYNHPEHVQRRHEAPAAIASTIGVLPEIVARAVGTEPIHGVILPKPGKK